MQNMLHICCTAKARTQIPRGPFTIFETLGVALNSTVVCLISNGLLVFLHSPVFTREPSRHLSLFWRGASRCVLLLSMQSTQWATVNFYFQYTASHWELNQTQLFRFSPLVCQGWVLNGRRGVLRSRCGKDICICWFFFLFLPHFFFFLSSFCILVPQACECSYLQLRPKAAPSSPLCG